MLFKSILFLDGDRELRQTMPGFFPDLNLDQVINSATAGKEEYDLKPFFYSGPVDQATLIYRQQVMRDLEKSDIREPFEMFAQSMRNLRADLQSIDKLYFKRQRQRLYLDVIKQYCDTLGRLFAEIAAKDLKSDGLLAFRKFLGHFIQSAPFLELTGESEAISHEMTSIEYCIHIDGLRVQVRRCNGEPDYSAEVEDVFSRFKEGAAKSYLSKLPHSETMNDIEAQILDGVASLFPEYFQHLDQFVEKNNQFENETIAVFDREIQFYLAWLKYIGKFELAGLPCCYPVVSSDSKEIYAHSSFDMALADKLIQEDKPVVVNDFFCREKSGFWLFPGQIRAVKQPSPACLDNCIIWLPSDVRWRETMSGFSITTSSLRTSKKKKI